MTTSTPEPTHLRRLRATRRAVARFAAAYESVGKHADAAKAREHVALLDAEIRRVTGAE